MAGLIRPYFFPPPPLCICLPIFWQHCCNTPSGKRLSFLRKVHPPSENIEFLSPRLLRFSFSFIRVLCKEYKWVDCFLLGASPQQNLCFFFPKGESDSPFFDGLPWVVGNPPFVSPPSASGLGSPCQWSLGRLPLLSFFTSWQQPLCLIPFPLYTNRPLLAGFKG